jgi:hypothetical protein
MNFLKWERGTGGDQKRPKGGDLISKEYNGLLKVWRGNPTIQKN